MPQDKQIFLLPLLLGSFFFLIACTPRAFSQDTAFEQLTVKLSTPHTVSESRLTKHWDPAPGIQLNLQTPFYAGYLEGGVRYIRFNNADNRPSYSDFHSAFVYLGWGYLFELTSKLGVGPQLRFGNNLMLYDEPKVYTSSNTSFAYDFDDTESEFAYELLLHTQYEFSRSWKAHAELAFNRTMTYHPLRLTFITVGFSHSFDTPSWFKSIFK